MALGVKTVVNLELLQDDRDQFLAAKLSPGQSASVDYFRILEWEPNVVTAPDLLDIHVAQFIAIVRTQAKPVYVHCRSGQNRTGVMVAAYRVLQGESTQRAIDEMRRYGGIWFKYDAAYIGALTGERRSHLEEMVAEQMPRVRREARIQCSASGCTESK